MPFRLLLLAIVFVAEKLLLSSFVDLASAQAAEGLGVIVRIAQHFVFRFLVTFGVAAALLVYARAGNQWNNALGPRLTMPISLGWGAAHVLLVVVLVALSRNLYTPQVLLLSFAAIIVLWAAIAVAAVLIAFRTMAPWSSWRRAAINLGSIWIYAFIAAVASAVIMQWSEHLWEPTARVTFYLVGGMLRPLVPALVTEPAALIFRTNHFAVQIAEGCSGLEGVGLMSVFCGAWLLYFRNEYRFPRALVLIPIGLVLVFVLNLFRIAAFVLIGDAGYAEVAIYGFHSQAGWIGFNLAAGAVVVISRKIRWWQERPPVPRPLEDNPTAAYLMPFLAVIAAGVIARTLSSGFELWYGLRLIAGLVLLFIYRERLLQLAWGISWRALLIGILGFAIWLLAAHWILVPAAAPQALLALSLGQQINWLVVRVISAVLLVPVVEELAFRAYLLRRLVAADFETVPFSKVHWRAVAGSSAIFGVLHGSMWLPGMLLGGLYGVLLCKTGRVGEAAAAHGVTNALVACSVLAAGQWQLW